MNEVTVITRETVTVPGEVLTNRMMIPLDDLEAATGWVRKPEGLCQGDVCVPVRDPGQLEHGDEIDLVTMAELLNRRVVLDEEAEIVAIANDPSSRVQALEGLSAPDFSLPDLEGAIHTFSESAGTKRVIVTFSSWCGCRYDLPGWQAISDELGSDNVAIILVAFDDKADDVRQFAEGISLPVLLDRQHLLSELYAISNVPTVVWIDEAGTIVRPNGLIFGTDTFADFTGVDSTPELDALRHWVRNGTLPMDKEDAAGAISDLSDDEIDARLHFRVGIEAKRQGLKGIAEDHLRRASELAPLDFSVRRAAMPLLGEDPFGQGFLDLYEEWKKQGAPYHGLSKIGPDKS